MSTDLKNLLHEMAEKNRASKPTIEEWQAAVAHLFADIRKWLKECDPEGVIEIRESQAEIREPGLGYYFVPRLDLRAFGKWIGIIPKARRTMDTAKPPQKLAPERAQGRVDITDEIRRYVLYRFPDAAGDVWLIDGLERVYDDTEMGPGEVRYVPRSEPKPFDQAAFEKALVSYLR